MSTRDAMLTAFELGLDLLEISPNADPPVGKIPDYGKFKYEQQKKTNEAKKKQRVDRDQGDQGPPEHRRERLSGEDAAMKTFIDEGDKVKVTLRFRGREMAHQDLGIKVLERIRLKLGEATKVEQMPRMENRQMIMVLAPK